MLICILTKNVITSCSVTIMFFLHLEVKPLMTLTTVLYLSCALISGHLALMLIELTKRPEGSFLVVYNSSINILGRIALFMRIPRCLFFFFFFSSRRRHTRFDCDWSSDVCSSDLERDELGDDVPFEYATAVKDGAFYGWPWYYIGDNEDPRHKGARPDLAGKVTMPDEIGRASCRERV